MSAERRDDEPPQPPPIAEILDGTQAGQEAARRDVQRAADQAVMAIFELAFSLESLSDAIRRLRAEPGLPFESGSSLTTGDGVR
jgi:hypothetical protein